MTWAGKWFKDVLYEPKPISVEEKPIPCPSCGSVLPAFSMCLLRSWVIRDGALVGVVTGERVACQAVGCGRQYSLGPGGAWNHNPQAQPYTGPSPSDVPPTGPPPDEPQLPRSPMPRVRPRG